MNKQGKRFAALSCAAALSLSTVAIAAGCGQHEYDPETSALVLATSQPDGVFNPFFSTSAYDSNIVGMTQIGMLSTDKDGKIAYGDNEPTVVKDYTEVTANEADGKQYTTYEFVIKNGIKFSDGEPLTIKDVLFNLYVYLDPNYTGSSTIYSTDIVGLQDYRTQRPGANDDYANQLEDGFRGSANTRVNELVSYVRIKGIYNGTKPTIENLETKEAGFIEDFAMVAEEFKKELESDWNSAVASMESYKEQGFTDAWQVFLMTDEGVDCYQKDKEDNYIKDNEGKYIFDPENASIVAAKEELDAYLAQHGNTPENIKEWATNRVYTSYFKGSIEQTNANRFEQVVRYWSQTAPAVLTKFTADARTEFFRDTPRSVPTVSGITTRKASTFNGKNLGADHDILTIKINRVDPKAIWNFGFNVAPMHYYSTHSWTNADAGVTNKDYIAAFDPSKGEFGLEYGNSDFMNEVVNANNKVGLPMGAGVYKASNATGSGTVTADNFKDNNVFYFERNTYFETLGSGINNAKIKYLRYQVIETDQVINSLRSGAIDFGEPNATQENKDMLDGAGIGHEEIQTNGYGYVGISARFVPNITVRRAIMKAMDTSIITQNYYKGGFADTILRPMSKASWAYPNSATTYVSEAGTGSVNYRYDSTGNEIRALLATLEDQGYRKINGVYTNTSTGDKLDYSFTIAGGSTDHPAYAMFLNAMEILNNKCNIDGTGSGIHVRVETKQTALQDLAAGKLAVWAAAWSSTIDPDMYQVYHKDSRASSVNNWGYDEIKNNKVKYATEWRIIDELSTLIDQGRETTDIPTRTRTYAAALDKVMELAVEFPTYQRYDMSAFNDKKIKRSSMPAHNDLGPYNGMLSRIWEVDYN